jgi:uncharacterized protein (TIGR03086 family)
MTRSGKAARRVGGVELLERAIAYALGAVQGVTPSLLEAPTPCRDWDLRELLHHVDDSLAALHEGLGSSAVGPDPAGDPGSAGGARADPAGDPARRFRDRARRLLETLTRAGDGEVVAVADLPLSAAMLASTGAIEIAVHGWDIARACGRDRPVPDGLAVELLRLCLPLVADAGRGGQFAAPVTICATAAPSDRLIAYLGRDPGT